MGGVGISPSLSLFSPFLKLYVLSSISSISSILCIPSQPPPIININLNRPPLPLPLPLPVFLAPTLLPQTIKLQKPTTPPPSPLLRLPRLPQKPPRMIEVEDNHGDSHQQSLQGDTKPFIRYQIPPPPLQQLHTPINPTDHHAGDAQHRRRRQFQQRAISLECGQSTEQHGLHERDEDDRRGQLEYYPRHHDGGRGRGVLPL